MASLNPSEDTIIIPDAVPSLADAEAMLRAEPLPTRFRFITGLKELRTGFKAKTLLHSMGYAMEGLTYAFKTQRNFRIHVIMGALVILAGAALHVSTTEWAILLGMVAIVLFAELTNTALELLVDMFVQERYDLRAKAIKDMAAGAVLVTALGAAGCGISIFLPHILKLLAL